MYPPISKDNHPVFAEYMQWVNVVDEICSALQRKHRKHLRCGLRCAACCKENRSLYPIEAFFIWELFDILPKSRLWKIAGNLEESSACPFLIDDLCEIYSARPLACRVIGLPLLLHSIDESYVEYCELNFTNRMANMPFFDEDVLPMHPLDLQLQEFNHRFITEFPQKEILQISVSMQDFVRRLLHEKGII